MTKKSIRLRGGPYDGLTVEANGEAPVLWTYRNMYNTTMAVRAGGLPWNDSMAIYVIEPGGDAAAFTSAAGDELPH